MPSSTPNSVFPFWGNLNASTIEYCVDTWQRSLLFMDALRERGNEYIEYEKSGKPPVLMFDYQIIIDARKLDRPVNYALAAIVPPPDCVPTDPGKRPFVVIDPRAGHGPGIGGSKMDSEIGIALQAGHPCYFVMFFPYPEPKQTIGCITHAERIFFDKINELHPNAPGKPFVIGNCQGGWALMLVAALAPQSIGPILLAGSPISYWAGVTGKHPMRYSGGLLGGTWAASFAGDLGNGKFDGANLVNNFEQLNPGNTYWSKLYNLYANVDHERERYLEFERWWGGHFILNKEEMEWISQNLFVGNRLSAGEIEIDGVTVDLRNIRSPIVVFASWGDNITPPQQALNWIPDLYDSVEQIRDNEQTIVYFLHEQVGHLGIFVSSSVAKREHSEFVSALDLIDVLPPGLYEAIIRDTTPDMPGLQYEDDRYVIRFEPRDIADILALGDGREGEKAFELVRHVSQINQGLYNQFVSPLVQMFSNETTATWLRNINPARFERLALSDVNPFLKTVKPLAEHAQAHRQPVAADNPWLQLEKHVSSAIRDAWDHYKDFRDSASEQLFKATYELPVLAALTGFKPDSSQRKTHGPRAEQAEIAGQRRAELDGWFEHGSIETGFLRLLIYVASGNGIVDERPFNGIKRVMHEIGLDKTVTLQQLKEAVRRQTFLVRTDEERALNSLALLLPKAPERQRALSLARELLALGGPISEGKELRLQRVEQVLGLGQPPETNANEAAAVKKKPKANRSPRISPAPVEAAVAKPMRKRK